MALSLLCLFTGGAILAADGQPPVMEKVRISDDGRHFVLGESGKAFVPWGFNYLGEFGKLVEGLVGQGLAASRTRFPRDEKPRRERRAGSTFSSAPI